MVDVSFNEKEITMGKIKGWLMEMEEDALIMPLDEWINKHGEIQKHVYVSVNGESKEVINLVLGESEDEHEETF
jgi:hypothetical protein